MFWEKFYMTAIEGNLVLFAALVYLPLEMLFPYNKKSKILRNEFWQDTLWAVSNEAVIVYVYTFIRRIFYISIVPLVAGLITIATGYEASKIPLENNFLKAIIIFFSMDFLSWVAHFADHRFNFLWRNHILHHSSEEIDSLAGLRGHWLDNFFMEGITFIPLLFFDIPIRWYFILGFLQTNLTFFLHANIDIPRWKIFNFIPGPHYHRWHHAKLMKYKYGQNFGFYTTIFDRVFKTYYNPEEAPESYGITDKTYPKSFLGRFFYPLDWKHFNKK